jgi:Exo-beta-D-glucosaminidase Ig-fold domain/Concanavalin A-like lectin/glucanases superfamily/Glycosyl hydrolases family 2/Glycosyl hydrolases family 2, sugar binding domain
MIRRTAWRTLLLWLACAGAVAAEPMSAGTSGPYNITVLQGGIGMTRSLPPDTAMLRAGAPWSITSWIKLDVAQDGPVVIAALGDTCLLLESGRLSLRLAGGGTVQTQTALPTGMWQAIAATYDGNVARLYVGGSERAHATASTLRLSPVLQLAPVIGWPSSVQHFGGSLAQLQLAAEALAPAAVQGLAEHTPAFDLVNFTQVGVGWPVQVKAWTGLQVPQDPWTLPHGHAAARLPVAVAARAEAALQPLADRSWRLGAWRMRAAPGLTDGGAQLSQPGYADALWYVARVPGTVLSTLIDRGVYPDPDYGLNNMLIPESLARQDYWYRTQFTAPVQLAGQRLTLSFEGINYAAEVWLNGVRLGDIRGAFIRGVFDVTRLIHAGGANALAVRLSPPPHPGIPSEESIAFGPGENGGAMAMDGPTFIDTEGWDWIPGIRDRDTGLWQDVLLQASGAVRILDASVITQLPLPRIDEAALQILVPLDNAGARAREVSIDAAFEGVMLHKRVRLPPGQSEVRFEPSEFPQLNVKQPRLWWPNGYGQPDLYHLQLSVREGTELSASRSIRFGIRQITYELSLFDHQGRLRRVEIDPTLGSLRGERLVDPRHEAIKQVPDGWAASLTTAGEHSPAVRDVATRTLAPYLVIRVNGTAIAARGGSWGMDDSRKRSSREHLEPFFRLHREAHLNIIRNWLGQNTEEVFYDLADEYGLLILNDFWESTEDFQLEAQDPALFLANARDTILRYRHHPSIAVWFGRNEGVPQPVINEGLADLVATLDGTRYYTGSSNRVNLQDSGPYNYRAPVGYFTDLARGFSVEVGTPSLATLESIEASIPQADRWPLSDTIAYHDWHFGGNGDVASFMQSLARQFGAADSLEDFERKAQMMNYVDYRAIFEGFQAHLWTQNSGRLLWMSHPAWPSNHWQMYSSDYDTQASYYGVKKAAEPLHVQMNLPDYALAVINTTREPRAALTVTARVLSLAGTVLATRTDTLTAPANQVTTLAPLALGPYLARAGVVLVALTLSDAAGRPISQNLYWPSRDEASTQALNTLKPQPLQVSAQARLEGDEVAVQLVLQNLGSAPALAAKLTLLDQAGQRILPAFYSDNYLSLLPGERRQIEIRYPRTHAGAAHVDLRGWNIEPQSSAVE